MKFQLMLILPGYFSSTSQYEVTLLSASMFATEGGVTTASDEIVTNPASANELCFLQIHGALCMTEDGFCLTVNGSSRVKRLYKLVLMVSQIFLLTLAQLFFALPVSDLKIASDTFHGDLASHQSMTSSSLSLSKRKC